MVVSKIVGIGMTSQRARNRLVEKIRSMGITNEKILEVMRLTPRHYFLEEALASRAYDNTALPIGYGQTISQPYMVASMTQILCETGPMGKVLEIGSGCGYQTAVLSAFAEKVFAVERIQALVKRLRANLYELKVPNVLVKHSDGFNGWAEHAPFDAILVAAAPVGVPEKLLEQLAVSGRLVIPIGSGRSQELRLIKKSSTGFQEQVLDNVSFVPLLDGIE
mgnify:CR=1 FL=1